MTLILSIDTSCDETAASVTNGNKILSNVLWSQASLHSKFGGVFPSLAKRAHEERIDWIIEKSLLKAKCTIKDIGAIAVTTGPGLAIALEVGIKKAKQLSNDHNKPLITVNHIEGHLLSIMARPNTKRTYQLPQFPLVALIASGKHTDIVYTQSIGNYEIIARTIDDAVGEALDKAARMLGLGYPGGALLEKLAKDGNKDVYDLPIPMIGKEKRMEFSYSGLKTAMYKLVENQKPLTKEKIQNLAACFQDKAFLHVERLVQEVFNKYKVQHFAFGGGVSSNIELRKRLRQLCKNHNVKLWVPYTKMLCTDNAAMIGVAAYYKYKKGLFLTDSDFKNIDRIPRAKIGNPFPWEIE